VAARRLPGTAATAATALVAVIAVAGLGLAAWPGAAGAAPPATQPADYPSALTARLAQEWKDEPLAADVVAGLDPGVLAALEAKVPLGDVDRSPLLSYRPRRRPAKAFDSVIVYAFGYRDAPDATRDPGPVNEALAKATRRLLAKHDGLPVFAQTEIAELLRAADVPDVTSIDPVVGPDGQIVYLSTAGVAAQAAQKAADAGIDLGTVAVIAFADHAGRSVLTTHAAGPAAAVPKGVALPTRYDAASAQPWTRDRRSYLATDLLGRVATL
jgi:hypothetical protein